MGRSCPPPTKAVSDAAYILRRDRRDRVPGSRSRCRRLGLACGRCGAAALLARGGHLCRRPAPRHRHRRLRRRLRPRSRRRCRLLHGRRPGRRPGGDDPDGRRVRRHAPPARIGHRRPGQLGRGGCSRRPDRPERGRGHRRAARPPRDPARRGAGGLPRPGGAAPGPGRRPRTGGRAGAGRRARSRRRRSRTGSARPAGGGAGTGRAERRRACARARARRRRQACGDGSAATSGGVAEARGWTGADRAVSTSPCPDAKYLRRGETHADSGDADGNGNRPFACRDPRRCAEGLDAASHARDRSHTRGNSAARVRPCAGRAVDRTRPDPTGDELCAARLRAARFEDLRLAAPARRPRSGGLVCGAGRAKGCAYHGRR